MIKIYHYVNLVDWQSTHKIMIENDVVENYFYVDTLSLHFLSKLYGFRLRKLAGVDAFNDIRQKRNVSYLVTSDVSRGSIILPWFNSRTDMANFIANDLPRLPLTSAIVIGISSPKQNELAVMMARSNCLKNVKEIHCFGAAVYSQETRIVSSKIKFFHFLLKDPRRTLLKMYYTSVSVIKLLCGIGAKDFRGFLSYFEKD